MAKAIKIHIMQFVGAWTLCGRDTSEARAVPLKTVNYDAGFFVLGGGIDTTLCANCVKRFKGPTEMQRRDMRRQNAFAEAKAAAKVKADANAAREMALKKKAAYERSPEGINAKIANNKDAARTAKREQRQAERQARRDKITTYRESRGV